ncbi:MAG: TauD/TfdA family dioxygenase [Planctomycetota bacterium]|nr:TauD/TfdA family dioxygenase [Planctomycetota bacterium]
MTPEYCREPWNAEALTARSNHLTAFPEAIIKEVQGWIDRQPAVVDEEVEQSDVDGMTELNRLARRVRIELTEGTGVARVLSPGDVDDRFLRRYYLAFGVLLGKPLGNYGRLYDVKDRGGDYTKSAIPVSQTRAATGLHTDSSARDVLPDLVGLICIRPARSGGASRITCALRAHQRLVEEDAESLSLLQQPHLRDIVTPGADRSQRLRNQFPVFGDQSGRGVTCRYMRFWIEKGYESAGVEPPEGLTASLDALDGFLEEDGAVANFRLQRGEMLWVDNCTTLHDRTEYVDDADAPRLLLRQWVKYVH